MCGCEQLHNLLYARTGVRRPEMLLESRTRRLDGKAYLRAAHTAQMSQTSLDILEPGCRLLIATHSGMAAYTSLRIR